jgi:hypothetical protein
LFHLSTRLTLWVRTYVRPAGQQGQSLHKGGRIGKWYPNRRAGPSAYAGPCDAEAGVDPTAAKPPAKLREAAAIRARLAEISSFSLRDFVINQILHSQFLEIWKIRFLMILQNRKTIAPRLSRDC